MKSIATHWLPWEVASITESLRHVSLQLSPKHKGKKWVRFHVDGTPCSSFNRSSPNLPISSLLRMSSPWEIYKCPSQIVRRDEWTQNFHAPSVFKHDHRLTKSPRIYRKSIVKQLLRWKTRTSMILDPSYQLRTEWWTLIWWFPTGWRREWWLGKPEEHDSLSVWI